MSIVLPLAGSETVSKIIILALKDAGVLGNGQTPSDDDTQTAFDTLMHMIALWRTNDLEVYCHRNISVPMTASQTYTIGPGGDVDTERPVAVEQAIYIDSPNTTSYPLSLIPTLEDWQRISVKQLNGNIPDAIHYETTFPLGTLYVWPQPSGGQIELTVKQPFPLYESVGDDLKLPPEYFAPLRFNLAKWICASFGSPLRPDISQLAASTLRQLKRVNTRIRQLQMPARLPLGSWPDRFNVYTDQP